MCKLQAAQSKYGRTLRLPLDRDVILGSVGQIVAVYGFVSPEGAYRVSAFKQVTSAVEYVPGATRIILTGRLSMI